VYKQKFRAKLAFEGTRDDGKTIGMTGLTPLSGNDF